MTKSNLGKVFIGMVLLAGSARVTGQFARESTLVPPGPEATALGIQTLRVHFPVGAGAVTTTRIEFIGADRRVAGHMIDVKSAASRGQRGNAPEEMIELVLEGRTVSIHYKDRAVWLSDGTTTAAASFDGAGAEEIEGVRLFADDLRLIAGIQVAARPVLQRAAGTAPTMQSSVLSGFGLERVTRIMPASFLGKVKATFLGASKEAEPVCHTEPAHAKCGGGFAASRSAACAYAQQEANNKCAEASGYCYGCCAWVGSGCDCACLFDDLACMCDACGGTCGPAASPSPSAAVARK